MLVLQKRMLPILLFLSITLSTYNIKSSVTFTRISNNEHSICMLPPLTSISHDKSNEELLSEKINFELQDGSKITAGFCDNNSSTLILLGKGCFNNYTHNNATINLFKEHKDKYDFAATNYRWNNGMFSYACHFPKLGIACFNEEVEAIISLVNILKKRKAYKKVIALGSCYSSYILIRAHTSSQNKLFDAIIAESLFPGIEQIINNGTQDPLLMIDPQQGGLPLFLKTILKYTGLPMITTQFIAWLFNYDTLVEDLKKITCPILLIYGKEDKLVTMNDFKKMWYSIPETTKKTWLITPYTHSGHDVDYRVYSYFCHEFINSLNLLSK